MRASMGVDELGTHADSPGGLLYASLKNIAHAKLLPDLLHVCGLAFVGEGTGAGDDKAVANARQISGQPLRNDVGQIILRRIPAQIGERKHQQGDPRSRPGRRLCRSCQRAFRYEVGDAATRRATRPAGPPLGPAETGAANR
jgi:hypothetical protein